MQQITSCSISLLLLFLSLLICGSFAGAGQGVKEKGKQTRYTFSYTPVQQFDSTLEGGNSFSATRHFFRLGTVHPLNRKFSVGLGLDLDMEKWDFDGNEEVMGAHPWSTLYRFAVNGSLGYRLDGGMLVAVSPVLEFAGESGTDVADGLAYGASISVMKPIGPQLSLGLGMAFFDRLEETSVFPYFIVDWQITDNLRLTNPFRAGPAGPAGLEMVYAPSSTWQFGFGGSYRSYRFRLAENNSLQSGIAENEAAVTFVRMQRQLSKGFSIDLYGGILLDGSLSLEDRYGNRGKSEDYDSAPFAGLTFSGTL